MKRTNTLHKAKKLSIFYYMPLLLMAGIVPLIVHGKYIDLSGTVQGLYWTGQMELLDFFSYWKSRWVIVLTAISLFTYIILIIRKKATIKKEFKYYIPLGIYAICVLVSTVFAIDLSTALNGFVDMYQGMWVLLSYVTITFLMINLINGEREINWFLNIFIFLIIVEGLIGVGQYFGFDIFNTKFGNSMIIPKGVTVDGGLKFNFGKHTIYGTLFNTNFVGSFATLMLPMSVAYLILARTKKTKAIGIIALVLCIFTWLGCNSRAGYVGVAFGCIVAIIMLRKYVFKYWKVSVGALAVVVICFVGLNAVTNGRLVSRVKTLNVFSAIKEQKNIRFEKVENINIVDNTATIKTNHKKIKFILQDDKVMFYDENNEIISVDKNNRLVDKDNNYLGFNIDVPSTYSGINLKISTGRGWIKINFYYNNNQIKFLSSGNKIVDFSSGDEYFEPLIGYENFMSGRGYIWGESIGMLKDYIIIGSGSDCFPLVFPSDISIYRINSFLSSNTVVDKSHNMYLQMAINTGVVSLISFLTVCVIYMVSSIKVLWGITYDTLEKKMGLVCFLGVIGYLFTGIFNDQIVSVAPLFYIILGLGISANIMLLKKDKKNVKNI